MMSRRFLPFVALLVMTIGASFISLSQAHAWPPNSGQSVTTTVSWPFGLGNSGKVNAKFVAAPNGDGTWAVGATFKPLGVSVQWNFMGHFNMKLQGVAMAQATATPGATMSVAAAGCYWSIGGSTQIPALIVCTFTIGANGVVSVSSISVSPS